MQAGAGKSSFTFYGHVILWSLIVAGALLGLPFWCTQGWSGPPAQALETLKGVLYVPWMLLLIQAAFGSQSFALRWIVAAALWMLGYAAWLTVRWSGAFGFDPDISRRDILRELNCVVLYFGMTLAPLLLWRLLLNWRIMRSAASEGPSRFQLVNVVIVMVWMAATVGYLLWSRSELRGLFDLPRLVLPGVALSLAALLLRPLALWIALRPAPWRRRVGQSIGYILLLAVLAGDVVLFTSEFRESEFSLGLMLAITFAGSALMAALLAAAKLGYELRRAK